MAVVAMEEETAEVMMAMMTEVVVLALPVVGLHRTRLLQKRKRARIIDSLSTVDRACRRLTPDADSAAGAFPMRTPAGRNWTSEPLIWFTQGY